MSLRHLYCAASRPVQRQLWMTVTVFAVVVHAAIVHLRADDGAGPLTTWVTPQNILTAVVLVYGAGMLREQFSDVKRRIEVVERDYLRREVFEAWKNRREDAKDTSR
jgi:hypothetical protein